MRCGSSLLQHLIAQDDSIATMGESHLCYRTDTDLLKLIAKTRYHNRRWRDPRRTHLDKLLQSRQTPPASLVARRDIRFVFLLRDPAAAAASLLRREGWPHSDDPETAAAYYLERLKSMREFAASLDPNLAMMLSYETLSQRSEFCLSGLSEFLGLERGLRSDYPVQRWTGRPYFGDVSEKIRAGRILPPAPPRELERQTSLTERLSEAHAVTRETLAQRFAIAFL